MKFTIDDVEVIFDYIENNRYYNDREDEAIVGKLSNKELDLQVLIETFAFEMMAICAKLKKYYHDEDDYFENYTLYLKYNDIKICIYILYGQGNYFRMYKADDNFKEELCVDMKDII